MVEHTNGPNQTNKPHRGSKDAQKSSKTKLHANGYNAKAFAVANPNRQRRMIARSSDIKERRLHVPVVDRTPEEPPPVLVAVVGPKGTGKTTLIKSLVRRYTKHTLQQINGPVTVVSGKRRRLTFFECHTDLNSMIDMAKCADLVLLTIDGNFGFEMETLEFLNIVASHGFPRIIGVTTHMDLFKNVAGMRSAKNALKHRFWTEVYKGAKLFNLSGIINGRYPDREILNLARFISIMKFRPLKWRNEHPYLLADRVVDITHPSVIEENKKTDRTLTLYGYLRGTPLMAEKAKVHLSGLGDFTISEVERLPDPCPSPYAIKLQEENGKGLEGLKRRRRLDEKLKTIFAPMSDVGGVMIDKDATYIDVSTSSFTPGAAKGLGEKLVTYLQGSHSVLGANSDQTAGLQLFSSSEAIRNLEDVNSDEELRIETEDPSVDIGNTGRHTLRKVEAMNSLPKLSDANQEEQWAFATDSELDDDDLSARKWKDNIDPSRFKRRQGLAKLIYQEDITAEDVIRRWNSQETGNIDESVSDDLDDSFLKPKARSDPNEEDILLSYDNDLVDDFGDPDNVEKLSKLFYREVRPVTGDANEEEQLSEGLEDLEADGSSEEDMTDVENDSAAEMQMNESQQSIGVKSVEEQRALNAARKENMRLQIEEMENEDRDFGVEDPENEHETWYDAQKAKIAKQMEINVAEYGELDPSIRDKIEGFRAGTYVRLVFENMPCEFIENFDPQYPVLIGGLLPNESRFGFSKVRIKRHRWYRRLLKTNDPLIISMGWRRFQTCPIYTTSDSRTRTRMLKYTPEHMYCNATFFGPLVSPNTGFCAVTSVSEKESTRLFRIAATGTVEEVDAKVDIVKKLKLIGHPYEIFKNTAFIKDMFSSSIEVARFEGAQIKTVSGIRGQIKRALTQPDGAFRATFEDTIIKSDIIILRAWWPVEPRKYYNPVTSLLLSNKDEWGGMRLTGAVRAERNMFVAHNPDSVYFPIDRPTPVFDEIYVPRSLRSKLPFEYQIPEKKPRITETYMQKRAVVLSSEERRLRDLMARVAELRDAKEAERQEKKKQAKIKAEVEMSKAAERYQEIRRQKRNEYFAMQGIKRKHGASTPSSKRQAF